MLVTCQLWSIKNNLKLIKFNENVILKLIMSNSNVIQIKNNLTNVFKFRIDLLIFHRNRCVPNNVRIVVFIEMLMSDIKTCRAYDIKTP